MTENIIHDDIDNSKIIKKGSILNSKKKHSGGLKGGKVYFFSYIMAVTLGMIAIYRHQIYENTILMIEEPKTIQSYMTWSDLSSEQKKDLLLDQIERLMSKNEEWNEANSKQILEDYQTYLEDYIEYFSRSDYLNTLLSTRFVDLENELPKSLTNRSANGVYTKKTIYYKNTNDEDLKNGVIFHEKIHADRNWEERIYTGLYNEVFTAYASKSGYEDIRGAFSLLGELFEDKQKLEEYFYKGENEKIWEYLKDTYPYLNEEISSLRIQLEKIYVKSYIERVSQIEEKLSWLENYNKIYETIYNQNPEEDLIVSYFAYQLIWNPLLENNNSLAYGTKLKIDDENFIDINNRKGDFPSVILKIAYLSKDEKYKYIQNIINSFILMRNREDSSEIFWDYLKTFCTETELKSIFDEMLWCRDDESAERIKGYILYLLNNQRLNNQKLHLKK